MSLDATRIIQLGCIVGLTDRWIGINPRLRQSQYCDGDLARKRGRRLAQCRDGDADVKHFPCSRTSECGLVILVLPVTHLLFSIQGPSPWWEMVAVRFSVRVHMQLCEKNQSGGHEGNSWKREFIWLNIIQSCFLADVCLPAAGCSSLDAVLQSLDYKRKVWSTGRFILNVNPAFIERDRSECTCVKWT